MLFLYALSLVFGIFGMMVFIYVAAMSPLFFIATLDYFNLNRKPSFKGWWEAMRVFL